MRVLYTSKGCRIGPDGGTISAGEYAEISVPEGALLNEENISATVWDSLPNSSVGEGIPVTPVLEMKPTGLWFLKPVTVRLRAWRGVESARLSVFCDRVCLDRSRRLWGGDVKFQIKHFSKLLATTDDPITLSVYVYRKKMERGKERDKRLIFSTSQTKNLSTGLSLDKESLHGSDEERIGYPIRCKVKSNDEVKIDLKTVGGRLDPDQLRFKIRKDVFDLCKNVNIIDPPRDVRIEYTVSVNGEEKTSDIIILDFPAPVSPPPSVHLTNSKVEGDVNIGGSNNIYNKTSPVRAPTSDVKYTDFQCENCKSKLANGLELNEFYGREESYERHVENICGNDNVTVYKMENPSGFRFEVVTFRQAECTLSEMAPTEYFTWFPGYRWIICYCKNCAHHVGWKYVEKDGNKSFFGLILRKL